MSNSNASKKVALVTGSSTGIGRSTVEHLSAAGWTVIATMRTPAKEQTLQKLPGVSLQTLDVTDVQSIRRALAETVQKHGRIDALVNNAGYGLVGAFEEIAEEQIRKQFETNVFGLMSVCREALPYLRKQGGGRIINISSVGGRITFPLYSAYHSTKWAVEGFTESLQYELAPFGIRTVLIEPGAIRTDFYDRSADKPKTKDGSPYENFVEKLMAQYDKIGATAVGPEAVAKVIVRAAEVNQPKLRYSVGGQAPLLLFLRRLLPDRAFNGMVKSNLGI